MVGPAECADPAEALELASSYMLVQHASPPEGATDLIEGGQRTVTAAPPFWIITVRDLVGITGRVYVKECVDAIVDLLILGRSWQIRFRILLVSCKSRKNICKNLFKKGARNNDKSINKSVQIAKKTTPNRL